jgi:hypothetical protein
VKDKKRVLKTHETGAIVAHINSDKFLGSKGAAITVTFDRPMAAQAQLRVRAHIRGDVMLRPGSVQLGTVQEGTAAAGSVAIVCQSQGGLRPVDVRAANPHLVARLTATGTSWQPTYRLDVRLDEEAPASDVHDQLMLVMSDRRTQIPVPVQCRVVAGVTVSPKRLLIGLVEPGDQVRKMVIVRGTAPFRIRDVRSDTHAFRLALPAQESAKPTHLIPVTFIAGDRPGKVVGTIHIQTDQGSEPVEVTAQAEVANMPPELVKVEPRERDPVSPPAETAKVAANAGQRTVPALLSVGHEEGPTSQRAHASHIPSLFARPADTAAEDN